MTVLILLAWVLAVWRLTRLVTRDKLTESIRFWVAGKLGAASKLTYLIHCHWCSSIWVAAATAPAPILIADLTWWWLPWLALAASQLVGLCARLDPVEMD